MNVITIPKKIANKGDLVIIPRKEYEALLLGTKKEKDWIYDGKIVDLIKKRSVTTHKEHKSGKTQIFNSNN
jgi:hypothetical protein